MNHTSAPLRTRAREQFEALLNEFDSDWESACDLSNRAASESAKNQVAEILNQGLRRMRQAKTFEEAAILSVETALPFSSRCAVFVFREDQASALAARDLGPLPLTFSPDAGAAFRACIETRDPVIAIATEQEISPELAARVGSDHSDRVYLLPLTVRDEVRAILFGTGAVQPAPIELIAGFTAMQMEAFTSQPVVKPKDLIEISGSAQTANSVPPKRQAWTDLTPDLQTLHLRAQREARLRVAEIRLDHPAALKRGVESSDIYSALRDPIEAARMRFRKEYIATSPTMVDYLYIELVRGLAQENEKLLGPQFPGPLV